jgi:DNA-binding IscR family transcriptional regulator
MRLTSKGRYAVTAMLDVALNSEAGPVPLADISERQGGDKCLTHALWRDLSDRLTGFLNNITLGELVNNQEVLDVSGRQHTHDAPRTRTQDAIDVKLRA